MSFEKPREIAVRALQRHEKSTDYIEDILESELARTTMSQVDRKLAQELTYGVVRWKATLDWLIDQKTQGRTQKPTLRILVRLGLYQIFWLERIPDHAAVNESVEMAKHLGFGAQAGFVNAILRGYLREQAQTVQSLDALKVERPSIAFSHPDWLFERWKSRWGKEQAADLLKWNNTPPQVFARVNTLRTNPEKLLAQWRDEGVEYDFTRHDWIEENLMFELKSFPPLVTLASFKKGAFYVQDPSTLLAVRELNPQRGESVLDMCAAPGGKTTFIAQEMRNEGLVVAEDFAANRLEMLKQNCTRLGVTCVESRLSPTDVSKPGRLFDRVLVDAPCSNTGVIRRRVDLRWRIRAGEIQRLRTTQLQLLKRAAAQVKENGTLVYSTCSLEPEENSEVVQEFLRDDPHFRLERERELIPVADHVDGAYVARFSKQTQTVTSP